MTVKANQKTLDRQIRSQLQGNRKIPFMAMDQEISHGRDITWTLRAKEAPEHIREAWIGTSWIVEVTATGSRDGKPFRATHLFLTSLRTPPLPGKLTPLHSDLVSTRGLDGAEQCVATARPSRLM